MEIRDDFSPTVLLVDDDPVVTKRWSKEFHQKTSLGVVVANSLRAGRELVDSQEIKFEAVVADIHFEYGTDDPDKGIFDGIDFLGSLQKRGIEVPMFVISSGIDMLDFKEKARKRKLPIADFFDKFVAFKPDDPAWRRIQRSVIERKFGSGSNVAQTLEQAGSEAEQARIDALNEAMCLLQMPVRTYIQTLEPLQSQESPSRLSVAKPIEVICIAHGPRDVRAYAPSLGLLVTGIGESVQLALEDLRGAIQLEAALLLQEPKEALSAYSQKVQERLSQYITLPEESHAP